MPFISKAHSSRILKSIVTAIATAQVNTSTLLTSNKFSVETYQIRVATSLPVWFTVGDSTGITATANSNTYMPANLIDYFTVSPGQWLAFISTSTSTGYVNVTEMT